MGVNHTLFRNNENFKGLDLRSSDIQRDAQFSSDMRNAAYRSTGAINKRKGFKISAQNPDNAYGVATFRKTNPLTGAIEDEFISINSNAHRLIDKHLKLEYNGSSNIWYSLYMEEGSSSFVFELKEQDNVLLTIPLGTGFSSSDKDVAGLAYDINNKNLKIAKAIPGNLQYLINVGSGQQAPGGSLPAQESQEYTLNLVASNITNISSLYIGQYIKLGEENTWLEIQDITTYKSPRGDVAVYGLSLYGLTNYIDSNGEVTEPVDVYQYYDVRATYDSSIATYKAALFDSAQNVSIKSATLGGTTLTTRVWQQIPNGDPNIQDSFKWITPQGTNALVDQEFENATFASLHNSLYVSNGYDYVSKYDGEYFYRAGLPIPATTLFSISEVDTGSSGRRAAELGTRQYKFVFEYTDALGNIITSQPSDIITETIAANKYVKINWTNAIDTFLEGRDLRGTFNSNHSNYEFLEDPLQSGTTTYRKDNIDYEPSTYAVGVHATKKYRNEKRLRVKVYRTKVYNPGDPPSQFYLIGDVPYNMHELSVYNAETDTIIDPTDYTLIDDLLDDELNVFTALVDPIKRHDPPPKGRYITTYKNCLVVSGQLNNVNNLQYSLPKNASTGEIGCEYFPEDSNGVIVDSKFGDKITAIAPLRDLLYIFHNDSIHILGGQINLLEDPMVDLLTKEGGVGCASHHSIEEFRNQLLFLSESGIYTIDASNSLQELSSPINPLFNDKALKFRRSVTFNWTDENLLVTMIPKEDYSYIKEAVTGLEKHPDQIAIIGSWLNGVYETTTTSNFSQTGSTGFAVASTSLNGMRGYGLKLRITITNNTDVDIEILEPGTGYVAGDVIIIPNSDIGGQGTFPLYIKITSTEDVLNAIYTSTYDESLIVAYDYFKNAWLRWDSLDFTGGVSIYRDKVMFSTRGNNVSNLCSMNSTGTKYDYADHAEAINFYYETNWESLGNPTIPKKFLRLKLYSMDTDLTFESSTFELLATFYQDYLSANLGTIPFSFGDKEFGWGYFPWGTSAWGNPSVNIQKHKLASRKSKSLKIRFSNTDINTNILLTNYEFEIAAPYQTEIKD